MTADEIRRRILSVTLANGGHLASSLGAVEIAMALAKVFDPFRDRIVWDVGHQAYAWKILTGRDAAFDTLRKFGGLSGFPNPWESGADASIAGHAGVAISVAQGYAVARDLVGGSEHVVAVVGDAALANGTSLEALYSFAGRKSKIIIVLNDNESAQVRSPWDKAFFDRIGIRYIGVVDGNDEKLLCEALVDAKASQCSVVIHATTRKGKGYGPAEADPNSWHAVSPGTSSADKLKARDRDWSACFGDAICALAHKDDRIVALTAAMCNGTGLNGFAAEFPDRFFDVGIAEGHMVAFAAGLASGGRRPVVAIYSTFLQRAIDQIMHDVCIANLPVVFCVDRAGIVGADGVTHQGIFDLAMLRCLPNLTICQPKDEEDLEELLEEAMRRNGPTVIRYPRGKVVHANGQYVPKKGSKVAIWTTGDWYGKACAIADRIGAEVVHARYLKPLDVELLARQVAEGMRIVSLENGVVSGGLGEAIGADVKFGWPDRFVPQGSIEELEKSHGLDVDSIVAALGG